MQRLTRKQIAMFQREAEATFDRLGFIKVDKDAYRYELETAAGLLRADIMEDWIACRFEDVQKAKETLHSTLFSFDHRLNQFSGKWNWDDDSSEIAAEVV